MAAGAFTVHDGNLDGDRELTSSLGLTDGARLVVSTHDSHQIVLQRDSSPTSGAMSVESVMAAWQAFRELGTLRPGTAQWRTQAEERKRLAQQELDRVYADPTAGATELKRAEREWELADDELDLGPFREG